MTKSDARRQKTKKRTWHSLMVSGSLETLTTECTRATSTNSRDPSRMAYSSRSRVSLALWQG